MELAHIPHVESAHEFDLSRGLSIELDPEVGRGILLEGAEEFLRFAAVDAAEPSAAYLVATSWRRSVTSIPKAPNVPGPAGIRTRGIPRSRASAVACSGPAPP